jgi:mRNA interferase MazF
MNKYIPERGDVVWIDMQPQAGHEQSGRRPAIVLSPTSYSAKVGLAVFCPITNQIKRYPFEVRIPSGFKVSGAILSDQIKSLDWKIRNTEFYDKLPEHIILEILKKIKALLYSDNDEILSTSVI